MEWINPKYADLVKAMRQAQADASRQDPPDFRPVRGFMPLRPEPLARCLAESLPCPRAASVEHGQGRDLPPLFDGM